MKKIITRILAVIGGLVVLLALIGWAQVLFAPTEPKLADEIVLTLDMSESLAGSKAKAFGGLLSQIIPQDEGVTSVVRAIDRARRDERVKGIVARFGSYEPAFADALEIQAALQRFKATNKFTIAYAASFGEGAGATKSYYLASTFAEIWLQPVGLVGLTGIGLETPFLRGLLDKLGLKPEFITRKSYKTAAANLTDYGLSPANQEMTASLIDDLSQQMISGIAANRGMPERTVQQLFGQGPYTAKAAQDAKLIDRIAYQDELLEHLKQKAGSSARLTNLVDYAHASEKDLPPALANITPDENKRIAVVNLRGPIHLGDSVQMPRRQSAGADTISSAISAAMENDDIKVIVLRIDSPGGSPAASETIRRAVVLAQQGTATTQPKPVIVSMGRVAASGGYWVASGAKYIVANPATLTGSIGVVIGKVSAEKLSNTWGVNWDSVQKGDNAGLLSPASGFNASQRRVLNVMADDIYSGFLERVASARGLNAAAVEKLAQGRVWTGRQAKDLKLVDELGGMDTAINKAKDMMGLTADTPVYIETLPRAPSRLQQVLDAIKYYQDMASNIPALDAAISSSLTPGMVQAPLTGF